MVVCLFTHVGRSPEHFMSFTTTQVLLLLSLSRKHSGHRQGSPCLGGALNLAQIPDIIMEGQGKVGVGCVFCKMEKEGLKNLVCCLQKKRELRGK